MRVRFLVNGSFSSTVSPQDRGLAYGDGVFETLKVADSVPEFPEEHLARLQKGCDRLAIPLDITALRDDIAAIIDVGPAPLAVLKITITRGGVQRGYAFDPSTPVNRYLSLEAIQDQRFKRMQTGVKLVVCRHRLPVNPALAGIKHLNRLDNVIARAEWRGGEIDEGLMLDTVGRVIEGTMSNLFLVRDRQLITARLDRCGVEGIIRHIILRHLAPALGLTAGVRDIRMEDLYRAEESFICNSLIGICPVVALGCVRMQAGPVTQQLQQALKELC